MDFQDFNNKDTEYYLNKVIVNQKKIINLLRLDTVIFIALIIIKLFVTG